MSKMAMVALLGALIAILISAGLKQDSPTERRILAGSPPVRTIQAREESQQVVVETPEREKEQLVMVRTIEEEVTELWEY